MVVPSDPVTTTLILFTPTTSGKLADAVPEATAVPFTFTVAAASLVVGVTVIVVTVFATLAVYDKVAEAKAGDSVPVLKAKAERLTFTPTARVITTV